MRGINAALAAFAALALASGPGLADPVADFYKGRQINWILSAGAGGGYSQYARAFAPYFSEHIPGKPNIIVQNMPGGGSLNVMNSIYNVAPKDGLTLAEFLEGEVRTILRGRPKQRGQRPRALWYGHLQLSLGPGL